MLLIQYIVQIVSNIVAGILNLLKKLRRKCQSIVASVQSIKFFRKKYLNSLLLELLYLFLNRSTKVNLLLWIPEFRDYLTKSRYAYFQHRNIIKMVNIQNSTIEHALTHNFDPNRMFFNGLSKRPDLISKPLSCEISVMQNSSKMRILLVGARTEAEIFSFQLCGFAEQNIYAIDLASYTPLIELMNADKLDYADNFFDIIVLGWVMEFVTNPDQIKAEISRCLKPNGILAIGSIYHPKSQDMHEYNSIKKHNHRIWHPKNTMEIAKYFGLKETIFNSDVSILDSDKRCDLVYIGRLGK